MPRVNDDTATVLLASPIRRRIVELIREAQRRGADDIGADALGSEGLTAAQLAKAVSLHVTTVRKK